MGINIIMGFMEMNLDLFAKALADDTRREMMKHLCCVWLSVNDLVDKLGGKVKQPTVSHHLKELEEAGLVLVHQQGRYRFYTLNREWVHVCCNEIVRVYAPDHVHELEIVPSKPPPRLPSIARKRSKRKIRRVTPIADLRRYRKALRRHRHWALVLLRKHR